MNFRQLNIFKYLRIIGSEPEIPHNGEHINNAMVLAPISHPPPLSKLSAINQMPKKLLRRKSETFYMKKIRLPLPFTMECNYNHDLESNINWL